MAITIDWPTKVISIPQADLTLISGTLYQADTEAIRLELHSLSASEAGLPFQRIFQHNTEVTVAGTTYARTIEIINGYSITFTPDSQWSVRLVGSNNNFFDIQNGVLNQNQVQVIPTNSAGLVVPTYQFGQEDADKIDDMRLRFKWMYNRQVLGSDGILTLYDDDGVTVLDQKQLYTVSGAKYEPPDDVPAERRDV